METLLKILNEMHPDVDFSSHTHLIDDGILDSFDIISLITELDDAFGVAVPAERLVPENFNSAQAIYNLVKELLES